MVENCWRAINIGVYFRLIMAEQYHQELIDHRLYLRVQMLDILSDEARYQSEEFMDCSQAIKEANEQLHALGVNVMNILSTFAGQETQLAGTKHPTSPSPKEKRASLGTTIQVGYLPELSPASIAA
jgi:hypothetical protein